MEHGERYARAREFYDVVTGPVGQLRRRCLRARRRQRHLFRPRQDARAGPQGEILLGARPAQYRASRAGLAGHRPGRRLRRRPSARGRDGRGGVRRRVQSRQRPALLCRRQRPHEEGRPQSRAYEDPARRPRRGGRYRGGGASEAGACSTPACTTPTPSPRSRSRSATMPPSSIRTGRCPRSPRPTPARAGASG